MDTLKKLLSILTKARPHALRAVCVIFITSFFLPYVNVLGCTSKKITTYHGYQLFEGFSAITIVYLVSIAIFAVFFISSFVKREVTPAFAAFAAAWRAISAAIAGFIVGLLPDLQFLFDTVFMLAGQVLGVACAAAVFIDGAFHSVTGYIGLRRERAAAPGVRDYSRPLIRFHTAAIGVSLISAILGFVGLYDEIALILLYCLGIFLPFVLAQCIVIEGVMRGEVWPRRWVWAVSAVLAGALALGVLNLL